MSYLRCFHKKIAKREMAPKYFALSCPFCERKILANGKSGAITKFEKHASYEHPNEEAPDESSLKKQVKKLD